MKLNRYKLLKILLIYLYKLDNIEADVHLGKLAIITVFNGWDRKFSSGAALHRWINLQSQF